jgi:hypothetical protein
MKQFHNSDIFYLRNKYIQNEFTTPKLASRLIHEGESAVCGVERDTVSQDFIVCNGGLKGADVGHYHSVIGLSNHPTLLVSKGKIGK